jgi:predicted dehydrogenase
MTLRTIHVGVGGRGTWPIDIMGADPKFEPVALVDLNRDILAAAQAKLKLPTSALFDDLELALNAVAAEAVVICTPTKTHAPLARIAFAHGKHVLVEKGMTMDWGEANVLVREADVANVKFCVAQNYRYWPNMRTIKHLLEDANHPYHPGQPQIVDMVHHRYRPEPRTLNYPFAMVWDMSCHHVDLLADWLGEARRVTALAYNSPWSQYQHDANIAAFIEYANGAVCQYGLTHTATLSDWRIIVQGERGALRTVDVPGVQFYPRPEQQLGARVPEPCDLILGAPGGEQAVADAFYHYIREGVEPGISGRLNLQTLAVCEMLVRSAQERRPVERTELNG